MTVQPTKAACDQRTETPSWLRNEIRRVIAECDSNIKEDTELAEMADSDEAPKYQARVQTAKHYRDNLKRILRGLTFEEDLANRMASGRRRSQ